MVLAAERSKVVVLLLLFIVCRCPHCSGWGGGLVLGLCFGLQYFVSFLDLQSSRWGKECWLLYICSVLNAMSLLSFFVSSSRCLGLVCNMGLWHSLVILTYFCSQCLCRFKSSCCLLVIAVFIASNSFMFLQQIGCTNVP